MPLIEYNSDEKPIPIADLVVDGTTIKRQAEILSLDYSWRNKTVTIALLIHHFSKKEDGSFGNRFPNIPSYVHTIIASNETLCDAHTGAPICPVGRERVENQEVVEETIDGELVRRPGLLFEKDYMHQYDFFKRLGKEVPVKVDELIIQFVLVATIT